MKIQKTATKLLVTVFFLAIIAACGKMNPGNCPELSESEVPQVVLQSFDESYPSQKAEKWFDRDGEAYVAYFNQGDKKKFAHFSLDGTLEKTEVDMEKDGNLKDEKEMKCDDFTMEELEDMATGCLKKMLDLLEEKQAWIKGAIEKMEAELEELEVKLANAQTAEEEEEILAHMEKIEIELDELRESQEEIERIQNKMMETLELIEQHEVSKEELCSILKKCWWDCDKEKGMCDGKKDGMGGDKMKGDKKKGEDCKCKTGKY